MSTKFHRICAHRSAFSLLELLFVGQIVVLLIAIAAPSLQAMRGQTKRAVCLDHLRALSAASRVYQVSDPSGMMIPVGENFARITSYYGGYTWGGKSGIGRDTFLIGSSWPVFGSKYGTSVGAGPIARPLNAVLYPTGFKDAFASGSRGGPDRSRALADTQLNLDVFRCPADDGPPAGAHCADWINHPDRSGYDHFGNSYAANNMMVGIPGRGIFSNSPFLRPASRVPNPARTLLYEESIGRWAWACRNEIPSCLQIGRGVDPGPTKAVRGWHGKNWTYNRSFIDGHSETQRVFIEGTEDADGYAEHYRSEPAFTERDPPPSPPGGRHCVTIRGDGWQKDTYPAADIPTGRQITFGGRPSYEDCVFSN